MQLSLSIKADKYKPTKSKYYEFSPIKCPSKLKRYKKRSKKPKQPVIYFLWHKNKNVYTGQTKDLTARIRWHIHKGRRFDSFSYVTIPVYYERMIVKIFKPQQNIYLK